MINGRSGRRAGKADVRPLAAAGVASWALLLAGTAMAQAPTNGPAASAPETQSAAAAPEDNGEILVTASRISSAGFTAPTPTTVLSQAQISAVAPTQVVDVLQLVPSFRTTSQPASATAYPDLRGLGPQRTLVLVNNRRHVSTFSDGTVDLNVIPAILVQRAEVVTGGASASWGSGAVSGVVNLILKNELQGVQASAQAGISSRGDDGNYLLSAAGGTSFADGRGHVLIGGEYATTKGIRSLQQPYRSRPWSGRGSVGNSAFATNGQPGTIYTEDARRADVSEGGLITNGPLRGITFEPNGAFRQFGYGTVYGNNMIGGTDNAGDAPTPGGDLKYPYERYNVMGRVSFDVTDALSLFAEGSYAHVLSRAKTFPARNNGAVTGAQPTCTTTNLPSGLGSILVPVTNPYLSQAFRDLAAAAGVTCFNLGRVFREEGLGEQRTNDGSPAVYRAVFGAEGKLIGDLKWNAYYQWGKNTFQSERRGGYTLANFRKAIDAVQLPNGQIVCRVNGNASTADDDPACRPFNLFGRGSASPESIAYITANNALFRSVNKQEVAALSIDGNLFDLWAGPVGIAVGGEWRKESINSVADAIAQVNGYQTGNRKSLKGSYTAKEVFGELAVPLLRDSVIAKSLDLSLAARLTDYSSSGSVTTWKVGGTWDVNDSIRLRASQSRDIRAGNLAELFTPSSVGAQNVRDPRTSTVTPIPVTSVGNPNVAPERADTFTAGLVLQPTFLPGFRASADYWKIDIKGQIGTIAANAVLERCFLDNLAEFCGQITQVNNVVTNVTVNFQNLDRFRANGVDLEASYRSSLENWSLPGTLSVRVLGTYLGKLETTAASGATRTDPSGQYTNPHWTVFGFLTYETRRFTGALDLRWYEGGKIDNTRVEGAIAANGVNINNAKSTLYTNLTLTADLSPDADDGMEVFFRVANLFDVAPPFPATGEGATIFDTVGRAFRAGVRVKM